MCVIERTHVNINTKKHPFIQKCYNKEHIVFQLALSHLSLYKLFKICFCASPIYIIKPYEVPRVIK